MKLPAILFLAGWALLGATMAHVFWPPEDDDDRDDGHAPDCPAGPRGGVLLVVPRQELPPEVVNRLAARGILQ